MSQLPKQLAAEFVGTALLLAAVVGSGIMGERLSGGNAAIALLANAIATGAVLYALIAALAPVSGAHFNPLVTLSQVMLGKMEASTRWTRRNPTGLPRSSDSKGPGERRMGNEAPK